MGNLLYDWQPDEAVKLWEQSASLDPSNAIVLRNLAIAYSHQNLPSPASGEGPGVRAVPASGEGMLGKAIAIMEKAVACERKYPIHFAELDELYAAAGTPVEKRLAVLEKHADIVAKRDDAVSRLIALKIFVGKYDDAIQLMTGRRFAVWEGGTLTVADSWIDAHLLRGQRRLDEKRYAEALADYQSAGQLPENLPAERQDSREAEVSYWTGCAHEASGDLDQARAAWRKSAAARAADSPRPRRGGGASAQSYYQAASLAKLGQADEARRIFQAMVESAQGLLKRASSPTDSTPPSDGQPSRRSPRTQSAQSHYLTGLGYLGLNEKDKARQELSQALEISPDHLGAKEALAKLPQ